METAIDSRRSLAELAEEHPPLVAAFERLRLDYCCGGGQTLADACERRGLDPKSVAVVLAELGATETGPPLQPHDLGAATISEICDHLVAAHHIPLRHELPRIAELLATVVRVHEREHPELHDLQRLFTGLEQDLLEHLDAEEDVLFPAARSLVQGFVDPGLAELVAEHAGEHTTTGAVLEAMRELADGYDSERAYCGTHRSLLGALVAFEVDLHQHVHEENNVLFPRVLAVLQA